MAKKKVKHRKKAARLKKKAGRNMSRKPRLKKATRKKAARLNKQPKRRVTHTEAGWMLEETVVPKEKFDRRSFRTIKPSPSLVLVIGCPIGKWDAKAEMCKVGTRLHAKKKAVTAAQAKRLKARGVPAMSNKSGIAARLRRQAKSAKTSKVARPLGKPFSWKPKSKKNYMLMTVTNPATRTELKRAKQMFKKWHFKDPSFATKIRVPDSYPNTLANLGQLEAFTYKTPDGRTRHWECPTAKRPIIMANPGGTKAYVFGGDFHGLPKGSCMTMMHYRVYLPPRSNRVRLGARRWYHPFDHAPVIHVNKTGFWVSTPVKPEGFSG